MYTMNRQTDGWVSETFRDLAQKIDMNWNLNVYRNSKQFTLSMPEAAEFFGMFLITNSISNALRCHFRSTLVPKKNCRQNALSHCFDFYGEKPKTFAMECRVIFRLCDKKSN